MWCREPNNWAGAWQTNKMTCAHSEDSDHPAHLLSLINLHYPPSGCNQRPEASSCGQQRLYQTGLVWVFAGCTGHFIGFCHGLAHIIIPPTFMPRLYSFCLSVRSSIHMLVHSLFCPVRGITSKFFVKTSQVEYISPTTHQKSFIFRP